MKLKDLISNREKLRKYDELNDALSWFRNAKERHKVMTSEQIKTQKPPNMW